MYLEFSGEGESFEVGVAAAGQVFGEDVQDASHTTGVAELAVELLAAAEGVGTGHFSPVGGGGELPEDAVEEETIGPGDEAGTALGGVAA